MRAPIPKLFRPPPPGPVGSRREGGREDQKLIIREKCENGEGPGGGCFRTTSATAQNSPLLGTGGPEWWKDSPWLFSKRGKRTVRAPIKPVLERVLGKFFLSPDLIGEFRDCPGGRGDVERAIFPESLKGDLSWSSSSSSSSFLPSPMGQKEPERRGEVSGLCPP